MKKIRSRKDFKVIDLLIAHGPEGYGVYVMLTDYLGGRKAPRSKDDIGRIAYELHARTELVRSVLDDFDLFECIDGEYFNETAQKKTSQSGVDELRVDESRVDELRVDESGVDESRAPEPKKIAAKALRKNAPYRKIPAKKILHRGLSRPKPRAARDVNEEVCRSPYGRKSAEVSMKDTALSNKLRNIPMGG